MDKLTIPERNKDVIKSGLQYSVTIPFLDPFMSSHVEDGIAVADKELREEIKRISRLLPEDREKKRVYEGCS